MTSALLPEEPLAEIENRISKKYGSKTAAVREILDQAGPDGVYPKTLQQALQGKGA